MNQPEQEAHAIAIVRSGFDSAFTKLGELGAELLPVGQEITQNLAQAAVEERADLVGILRNQARTLAEAGRREVSKEAWQIFDTVMDALFMAAITSLRALTGGPR